MPTLLAAAVKNNDLDAAAQLLDKGAKVDEFFSRFMDQVWTAVHAAAFDGQVAMLRLLIDRGGAQVNLATPNGVTPLYCALMVCAQCLLDLL